MNSCNIVKSTASLQDIYCEAVRSLMSPGPSRTCNLKKSPCLSMEATSDTLGYLGLRTTRDQGFALFYAFNDFQSASSHVPKKLAVITAPKAARLKSLTLRQHRDICLVAK